MSAELDLTTYEAGEVAGLWYLFEVRLLNFERGLEHLKTYLDSEGDIPDLTTNDFLKGFVKSARNTKFALTTLIEAAEGDNDAALAAWFEKVSDQAVDSKFFIPYDNEFTPWIVDDELSLESLIDELDEIDDLEQQVAYAELELEKLLNSYSEPKAAGFTDFTFTRMVQHNADEAQREVNCKKIRYALENVNDSDWDEFSFLSDSEDFPKIAQPFGFDGF